MNPVDMRAAKRMMKDEKGATGVLFGLMIVPVVTLMGAALDYSRALHMQEQLQRIADQATIAGLDAYRQTNDLQKGQERIMAYIDSGLRQNGMKRAKPGDTGGIVVSNTAIDPATSTAMPKLEAKINTMVLGLIGVPTMDIDVQTKVAVAADRKEGSKALELSLVLDMSGSMQGQKIDDLKTASKDFLDIVMPADADLSNRKVGLVPFTNRVNAGQFASVVTGLAPTQEFQSGTKTIYVFSTTSFNWRSKSSCGDRVQEITEFSSLSQAAAEAYCVSNFAYSSSSGGRYWTPAKVSQTVPNMVTKKLITCVTERQGAQAYTDAAPSTAVVGSYNPTNGLSSQYSTSGVCSVQANETGAYEEMPEIKALTTDRDMLKAHIDTFHTYGGTAGHLATAWAQYMLAPNWNSVFPSDSNVVAYDEPETVKAAVIMTDGEYNSNYSATSASNQARAICTQMKNNNIKVYTIGFDMDVNSAAAQLLRDCASPGAYYFPYDGNALKLVFQEIGNNLVSIVNTSSDGTKVIVQQ